MAPSCFALRAGDLCYCYHWLNLKLVQFSSSQQQKHSSQTVTAVYHQYSMMRCAIATRAHVRQLLLFDLSFQHEFTWALANFTGAQARVWLRH